MPETDRLLAQAVAATRGGDLDGAVASLESAVELDPACRRAWALLAAIHARRGDEALARAAAREAGEGGAADDAPLLAAPAWEAPAAVLRAGADAPDLRALDDATLEIAAGEGAHARLRACVLHAGAIDFAPAARRRKGTPDESPFSDEGGPLYRLDGEGLVLLRAAAGRFTVLDVPDGGLFLRESALEAFRGGLAWENGRLPGRGDRHAFVELQGRGRVAVWTRGRPLAVAVAPARPARAAVGALVGWVGRVVPVVEEGEGAAVAACEGEGQILLDPAFSEEG